MTNQAYYQNNHTGYSTNTATTNNSNNPNSMYQQQPIEKVQNDSNIYKNNNINNNATNYNTAPEKNY